MTQIVSFATLTTVKSGDLIMKKQFGLGTFVAASVASSAVFAATLEPQPVISSSLTLMIEQVGQVDTASASNNYASPVVVDGDLMIVNQRGNVQQQTNTGFVTVLDASNAPTGITLVGREAILNVADGPGDSVFVAFTSSSIPDGVTAATLPTDPIYTSQPTYYQVVYKYERDASGALVDPQHLAAFEARSAGHTGGGMLTTPEGNLLFATGDNLPFNRDGLSAPQDDGEHVSKVLLIDGGTGDVTVAAKGVRNIQKMTYTDASQTHVAFGDIGAQTAEEINVLSIADLNDTATVENLGWGRNADGNAREGTFYINDGATSAPGTTAMAIGEAPTGEVGFIQPFAQFGREGAGFIAVSGPIASDASFDQIGLLFSDLSQGGLYATLDGAAGTLNDVFAVNLVDQFGSAASLLSLANASRTDPRLFNFADGTAGVFIEGTGAFYRLTEISAVPLPAGLALMMTGLGGLALMRRRLK